jgi:hypothetical protein
MNAVGRPTPPVLLALVPLLLAPGALAAGGGGAQRALPAPAPFPTDLAAVQVVEGTTWAAGTRYKARFEEGGFEIFPALGEAAPRNYPLAFRLESVSVGGAVLWSGGPAPAPRVEDLRVTYERTLLSGGTLAERYVATPAGLEQSFVLRERPAASGDLVVRGRIATSLAVAAADPTNGIELRTGALGGLSIGGVTGVDAAGRRAAGTIRLEGDVLELALSSAFVDAAAYPLVLDPVYAPVVPLTASAANPDAAWEEVSGRTIVVFESKNSASDWDIRGFLLDGSGAPVGLALIDLDLDLAVSPSVATNAALGVFGVAWIKPSPSRVNVARVSPLGIVSPRIGLSSTCCAAVAPDVGGDLSGTGDGVLVVWQEVTGTKKTVAARVTLSGALPSITKMDTVWPDAPAYTGFDSPSARISQGVASGRHLIVFPNTEARPYARAIQLDGTLDPNIYSLASLDSTYNAVDGDGVNFWVAYATDDAYLQRVSLTGSLATFGPPVNVPFVVLALGAGSSKLWAAGGVWDEPDDEFEHYLASFDPITGSLCDGPDLLATSDSSLLVGWGLRGFSLAMRRSGSAGPPSTPMGYYAFAIPEPLFTDPTIYGLTFSELGPGGPTMDLGGGCGGGICRSYGPPAIGVVAPYFGVTLDVAPPEATTALLNVGFSAPLITCGSCEILPFQMTASAPVVAGHAELPLAIPCDPNLVGAKVQAQWTVFPTNASPCPLAPHFAFSNRWEIEIGS